MTDAKILVALVLALASNAVLLSILLVKNSGSYFHSCTVNWSSANVEDIDGGVAVTSDDVRGSIVSSIVSGSYDKSRVSDDNVKNLKVRHGTREGGNREDSSFDDWYNRMKRNSDLHDFVISWDENRYELLKNKIRGKLKTLLTRMEGRVRKQTGTDQRGKPLFSNSQTSETADFKMQRDIRNTGSQPSDTEVHLHRRRRDIALDKKSETNSTDDARELKEHISSIIKERESEGKLKDTLNSNAESTTKAMKNSTFSTIPTNDSDNLNTTLANAEITQTAQETHKTTLQHVTDSDVTSTTGIDSSTTTVDETDTTITTLGSTVFSSTATRRGDSASTNVESYDSPTRPTAVHISDSTNTTEEDSDFTQTTVKSDNTNTSMDTTTSHITNSTDTATVNVITTDQLDEKKISEEQRSSMTKEERRKERRLRRKNRRKNRGKTGGRKRVRKNKHNREKKKFEAADNEVVYKIIVDNNNEIFNNDEMHDEREILGMEQRLFSSFPDEDIDKFSKAVVDILLPTLIHFEKIMGSHVENLNRAVVSQELRLELLEQNSLDHQGHHDKGLLHEPQADWTDNKAELDGFGKVVRSTNFSANNVSSLLEEITKTSEVPSSTTTPTTTTTSTTTTTTTTVSRYDFYEMTRQLTNLEQKVEALEMYNSMGNTEVQRTKSEVVRMDDKVTELERNQRNLITRTKMQTYRLTEFELFMTRSEVALQAAMETFNRMSERYDIFKDRMAEFKSELHRVTVTFSKQNQISEELRAADSYKAHDIQDLRKSHRSLEDRLNGIYRVVDENADNVRVDAMKAVERVCDLNDLQC